MKCRTKACRGTAMKHCRSPYCAKCRYRRFRDAHPIACAFNNLRKRAKQRGHEFSLTFAKFSELWSGGLAANHGKTKFSLCVDRVRDNESYRDGNVALITLSENTRKRFVPFFRDKAAEEAAIAETSAQIREAYPELV